MATLSIFANFYINSEETFLRMKDSCNSFKDIDAKKWVINIRGKFKSDALFFLSNHLGDKLVPFALESENGWFFDTNQMLDQIDTDFVLFWVEDHINQVEVTKYQEIIEEMKLTKSEYLGYSWWFSGQLLEIYKGIKKTESKNISTFVLDKENNSKINKKHSTYIISMLGIFSVELFKKIVKKGTPVLRGYPKKTPLDFEKGGGDTEWLPVQYALPKYELFASIDDGGEGYSLQSRGLYPKRVVRPTVQSPKTPHWKFVFRVKLRKYIPDFIYNKLIRVVIFYNKFSRLIVLLWNGM